MQQRTVTTRSPQENSGKSNALLGFEQNREFKGPGSQDPRVSALGGWKCALEQIADLAEDYLGLESVLPIGGRFLDHVLERFFVCHTRVDWTVVQITESDQRSERDSAIPTLERQVLKERKDERRGFLREGRVGILPEDRRLRTLNRVHESELRLDETGEGLAPAELRRHRAMQLDQLLNTEVANPAVSR